MSETHWSEDDGGFKEDRRREVKAFGDDLIEQVKAGDKIDDHDFKLIEHYLLDTCKR